MTVQNSTNQGKKLIILGFVTIGILFLMYGRYKDPMIITPSAIDTIQRIAYGFYIILIVSFGSIADRKSTRLNSSHITSS